MTKQTTRIRRSFTPQFRKDAVALVQQGKSVTAVARELGIARSLLVRWKDQLEGRADEPGAGKPSATQESEEMRVLQKKLRDVTEERDILKKALAYFADDQK
jgi:transposase